MSIFPESFEAKVGFDQVRRRVEDLCLCPLGQAKAREATFTSHFQALRLGLEQMDEMKTICLMDNSFPADGYADMTPSLARMAHEGSWLDEAEMVALRRSLEAIRQVLAYLARGDRPRYPHLAALASGVAHFPFIAERIDAIIDRYGRVKDNASAPLARIRSERAAKQASVSKRIGSILRAAQAEGIVDPDVTPSVRDGRIVIPVTAANKRKIKGLIHDESASGRTVYVEPVELVELNNEIRELEHQERREVIRILVAFADALRPYLPELLQSYDFLGAIDFIRAKALYAIAHRGAKPILVDGPRVYLRQAVHPVLMRALSREGREVVPLDLELNAQRRILLISGPNAGGKSVCLKTVGVAQYMLQCGFLPPVLENSEMGIFGNVFIDIGDEQSLENDLSTYSSHLQSMKHILRHCDGRSLVLIDEFGSGTEPMAGGAIAEAILEQLRQAGAFGVITTHYSNLKHYASSAEGILNGAMQFDMGRMEPLFRLEMGKPGSSFAFEIARKIGLPEDVLKQAEGKVGADHVSFERHLREISRDKRYWERKRESIRLAGKRSEGAARQLEEELQQLRAQRQAIIAQAKAEAKNLLADTNRVIEGTIREIREAEAERARTRAARAQLEAFRQGVEGEAQPDPDAITQRIEKLSQREERRRERGQHPDDRAQAGGEPPLAKGDKVRLMGQEALGEVMDVGPAAVVVAFGSMITSVAGERLQRVSAAEYRQAMRATRPPQPTGGLDLSHQRLHFTSQIDVRGYRAEEAIAAVQALVDQAAMIGYPSVRILHGKGNGILRQQIRAYLNTVPHVASFADERLDLGGTGITVVDIG